MEDYNVTQIVCNTLYPFYSTGGMSGGYRCSSVSECRVEVNKRLKPKVK